MKKIKILLLFTISVCNICEMLAQIDINNFPFRTQSLTQYTSVFICSPNNGTIIQNVHNDADQDIWFNSDRFYEYNNGYVQLPQDEAVTTMQPGKGYVLQLGGAGNIANPGPALPREFNFSGGTANNNTVSVSVTANQFNLLGNPYNNFLDLDLFLLSANNRTKVTGPIRLWSHNTIISQANSNPNDPSPYRNSANDFALYNVLGGVAAGRSISTSADQGTATGIQTPNGKICFGTGFGIFSIGSGNVTYDNSMRTNSNGGETQSFRMQASEGLSRYDQTTAAPPAVRSRIWVNLEQGTPPVSGINTNPLKQILVGYSPCYGADCATVGDSDRVFDAETVTAQSNPLIDLYSFAANSTRHLAIQGRGDFQPTDSFQLGYKVTTAGDYTFTSTADGIFPAQPYYIFDFADNNYHPLPYTFNTAAGTFDTRFKVVFENLVGVSIPNLPCGSQIAEINTSVYSTLVAGATGYKFEVRTGGPTGPILGEFNGGNPVLPHVFSLNLFGVTYNTEYWISVATYQIGGVWQYGPSCMFKTPLAPTTRTLNNCGITLPATINNTWTTLYTGNTGFVGIPITTYRFIATINGVPFGSVFETAANSCNLHSFGATLTANTTYSIQVQLLWNGVWQAVGDHCHITTSGVLPRMAHPGTYERFEVSASPNPSTSSFKLHVDTISEGNFEVDVYDMIGRLIESYSLSATDVNAREIGNEYQSGVYNVIVSQADNVKTLRVIKR